MILYAGKFRPGRALASEHGLQHKFGRRIAEDFWKLSVGDGWENGNVTRVALIKYRSSFCQVSRENS